MSVPALEVLKYKKFIMNHWESYLPVFRYKEWRESVICNNEEREREPKLLQSFTVIEPILLYFITDFYFATASGIWNVMIQYSPHENDPCRP